VGGGLTLKVGRRANGNAETKEWRLGRKQLEGDFLEIRNTTKQKKCRKRHGNQAKAHGGISL